jgi:hypothetical protein
MRKGLLRKVQPPPGNVTGDILSRIQENVSEAFETVSADHDVISSPTVRLVASAPVPVSAGIVVFSGATGCTLTLPLAAVLGAGVGMVVHLMNLSTAAVTLARSGTDTLNGAASLSLAAGKLAILVADGVASWKAATS